MERSALSSEIMGNFIDVCCELNTHAIDVALMEVMVLLTGLNLVEQLGVPIRHCGVCFMGW
jgi:hypothetical protein